MEVGGMAYLATLAFPESTRERDKFITAMQAWYVRRYTSGSKQRRHVREEIRKYRPRDIFQSRPLTRALRRFDKRLIAARMAILLAGQDVENCHVTHDGRQLILRFGTRHLADRNVRPLSVRFVADWSAGYYGYPRHTEDGGYAWDTDEVIGRIWAPSKPVVHMAVPMLKYYESNEDDLLLIVMLASQWLPDAVAQAEYWRNWICQSPRTTIDCRETIQVTLEK